MKRTAKLFFGLLLCVMMVSALPVQAAELPDSGTCGEGLTWVLDGDVLTVSGTGKMDDFQENAAPWQQYRDSIRRVVIEPGVTSVGNFAFHKYTNLTDVQLPEGLTRIGQYAFSRCSGLAGVDLPDSLTQLPARGFQHCTALTEISVPGSVSFIGYETFIGCDKLANVTIGEGVETIGENVFQNCPSLRSIRLPDSVELIGISAFWNCTGLEEVYLGSGVNSIGEWAFNYCGNLRSIRVSPENPHYLSDDGVMYTRDMTKLMFCPPARGSSLTIPASVEVIWADAFCNGSKYLDTLIFQGDAPDMEYAFLYNITATCYYPADNATWTEEVRQQYEGSITWVPLCSSHRSVTDAAVAPTCTSTGLTAGSHCGVCNMVLTPQEVIPATGHHYAAGICTDCGDELYVPQAPKVTASNVSSSGKPKLTWAAVDGAAFYEVYRAAPGSGSYTLMKTTENTVYTNTTAKAGVQYDYYVSAYDARSDLIGTSDKISCTCGLPRPVVTLSNVASSGKIRISWEPVEGAVKYEVYRATEKDGTYTKLTATAKTVVTNTSTTAGKTYYYKVRAIAENTAANSAYSSMKYRTCDLPQPVVTLSNVASSGKIRISWEPVAGAVKYEIYRATEKDGTYTKLTATAKTAVTNTSTTAGKIYYYKVRAIAENTAANSAYSSMKYRTCDLARPVVSVALNSSGKPIVSWKADDGAVKYTIYIYDADGRQIKTSSTTKLKVTHGTAVKGSTYSYRVVAVHASTAANSAKSAAVSIKAK